MGDARAVLAARPSWEVVERGAVLGVPQEGQGHHLDGPLLEPSF